MSSHPKAKAAKNAIGVTGSVKNSDPKFYAVIREKLKKHPAYDYIFADTVDIAIRRTDFGHLEFQAVDSERKRIAFQLAKLYMKPETLAKECRRDLIAAMRSAIANQAVQFRNDSVDICVLCGARPTAEFPNVEFHVDHNKDHATFKQLSEAWLQTKDAKTHPTYFDHGFDNMRVFNQRDLEFAKEWQTYHKEHAVLRMLCKHCNLTI